MVQVAQAPEIGNVRIINVALPRQNARAQTLQFAVEAIGKNRRAVSAARPLAVFQQPDVIGFGCQIFFPIAQKFFDHRRPVFHRAASQIIVVHIQVLPDVINEVCQAKCLRHIDTTRLIEAESDRVLDLRLRREQIHLEALRHLELLDGQLRVAGFVFPAAGFTLPGVQKERKAKRQKRGHAPAQDGKQFVMPHDITS